MTHLMNSAIMPKQGKYDLFKLFEAEFVQHVQEAHKQGRLTSYIGYEQTAQFIERLTGVPVKVNRDATTIQSGDIMLICKLKYRVKGPDTKGLSVDENDFEYFICYYE